MTTPQYELQLMQGENTAHALAVQGTVRVGRAPENHVSVPDDTVSWHHAQVWLEGATPWIRDLGSRNGTFVNEEPLRGPRALAHGDMIRIGTRVRMRLWGPAIDEQQVRVAQLVDKTTGVRLLLQPGAFRIGASERCQLRIPGAQALEGTVVFHDNGEIWLTTDDEEVELELGQSFEVAGRQLSVVRANVDHVPTVDFTASGWDYHLRAGLNGPRGPFGVLEDRRTGRTWEASGNRAILLYLLGKRLKDDRDRGASEEEEGWCTDAEISVGLWGKGGGARGALNVLVHRTRKAMESADFDPWFIEKRRRGIRARLRTLDLRDV